MGNLFKKFSFTTICSFAMMIAASAVVLAVDNSQNPGVFQYKISVVPADYKELMKKNSWHPGCPVPLKDLAYISLSYWGFDNNTHTGILIVHKKLAREVVNIFHELYDERFPIERMEPMEAFKANEKAAMAANNTWAFNCQPITGDRNNFSLHSYGYAININPLINPVVKGNQVLPQSGKSYLDRSKPVPGMIIQGDHIYQLFIKHGWTWGGAENDRHDYRQFEKNCNHVCKTWFS